MRNQSTAAPSWNPGDGIKGEDFDLTNIDAYMAEDDNRHHMHWAEHYSVMAPPFGAMHIEYALHRRLFYYDGEIMYHAGVFDSVPEEYQTPEYQSKRRHHHQNQKRITRAEVMVFADDVTAHDWSTVPRSVRKIAMSYPGMRWLLTMYLRVLVDNEWISPIRWSFAVPLDGTGRAMVSYPKATTEPFGDITDGADIFDWEIMGPVGLGLSLMNCKNVVFEDAPLPPRHVRRRM